MLGFPQGVAAHAMICADVRLTELANYQPHDAPIPHTLLRNAIGRPDVGRKSVYEDVCLDVDVGREEGNDLFNKSFTSWVDPTRAGTDGRLD